MLPILLSKKFYLPTGSLSMRLKSSSKPENAVEDDD